MTTKNNPTVPCTHCKGSGRAQLTKQTRETLELVRGNPGKGAEDLGLLTKLSRRSMSKRLAFLVQNGLVARERSGRNIVYRVK